MDITKAHRAFSILKKIKILDDFQDEILSELTKFECNRDDEDDLIEILTKEVSNFTVNICSLNRKTLEKDLEKL